jgi:hypothetical protein
VPETVVGVTERHARAPSRLGRIELEPVAESFRTFADP